MVMAGGVPVYVPLRPSTAHGGGAGGGGARFARDEFTVHANDLRLAMSARTKLVILNNPHNPTGKMFSRAELLEIAAVVREHPRALVLSDEVYEHVVYGGELAHERIASLPGMWERTLTVSSIGKTFSCTGWKIGAGPPPRALLAVHGACCRLVCGPLAPRVPGDERESVD